jgi:RNA polymerase sigma-B factor
VVQSPDAALDAVEHRHILHPLVSRLPEREQLILRLRFQEDLTQREIAAKLGMSQMHVSRLLARSLSQLRHWSA